MHDRETHVTVTGMTSRLVLAVSVAAAVTAPAQTPAPAEHPGLVRVLADTPEARAQWDRRLARMVSSGALKVREQRDASPSGPRDQWLDQLHKGVPVVGGELWRRLEGGALVAAEGTIYEKITINPVPRLTRLEVQAAATALAPESAGPSRPPELLVLPTAKGDYALVYRIRVFNGTELVVHYLDASTGAVVLSESSGPPPPPGAR